MSNIDWSAIRADYEGGMSLRPLAAKYGVSKTTLIRKRDSEGWTINRTTGPRSTNQAEQSNSPALKKRRMGQYMNDAERHEAQQAFLESYVQTANILTSCQEVGIDRSTVYYWQEHDAEFMLQFRQADAEANLMVEAEIKRRAIDGLEKPLVSAGRVVYDEYKDEHGKKQKKRITIREYSDTLLMFFAKKRMPEYREKSTLDVNTNAGSVEIYKVRIPDDGRDS